MSFQVIHTKKYIELRSLYEYHIDTYNALYQLKLEKEEELNSIYKMIKTNLLDSKKFHPKNIIRDILKIIQYNNRYAMSYLSLAKFISDDYNVKEVTDIPIISNYLYNTKYGKELRSALNFTTPGLGNVDFQEKPSIFRTIMYNDKEMFSYLINCDDFDENERLESALFPNSNEGYSYLELCCYYGAVDCFKLLISYFDPDITQRCLELSFIGKNKEIISKCLENNKPNEECMKYAIISHDIDLVMFLKDQHNIEIDLFNCGIHNNLQLFLVYLDQTNDVINCFFYSTLFDIPSLTEYIVSIGRNIYINGKDSFGKTALHYAAEYNNLETATFLLSQGINVNEKDIYGATALHIAANKNNKETVELLLLFDANINDKDQRQYTPLHAAVYENRKETVKLLLSYGANVNEKDGEGATPLNLAAFYNCKEIIELLLSSGANVNEKDKLGQTALHSAAYNNCKESAEILLSHGANINEKDICGLTPIKVATYCNSKETAEILISYGAILNEKMPFQIETQVLIL